MVALVAAHTSIKLEKVAYSRRASRGRNARVPACTTKDFPVGWDFARSLSAGRGEEMGPRAYGSQRISRGGREVVAVAHAKGVGQTPPKSRCWYTATPLPAQAPPCRAVFHKSAFSRATRRLPHSRR